MFAKCNISACEANIEFAMLHNVDMDSDDTLQMFRMNTTDTWYQYKL